MSGGSSSCDMFVRLGGGENRVKSELRRTQQKPPEVGWGRDVDRAIGIKNAERKGDVYIKSVGLRERREWRRERLGGKRK